MAELLGFIFKVLALSALISIGIRYGGLFLTIPATPLIVLTMVCLPTLLMAIVLGWRGYAATQQPKSRINS
jgi:xanthosine utilization system XapX-like protein